MTPEEIWHKKSDEELLTASERLGEYTEVGQRVIITGSSVAANQVC